jgi:hypothetical protein
VKHRREGVAKTRGGLRLVANWTRCAERAGKGGVKKCRERRRFAQPKRRENGAEKKRSEIKSFFTLVANWNRNAAKTGVFTLCGCSGLRVGEQKLELDLELEILENVRGSSSRYGIRRADRRNLVARCVHFECAERAPCKAQEAQSKPMVRSCLHFRNGHARCKLIAGGMYSSAGVPGEDQADL